MKNFRDKTVVITGAGSGMGRAYALAFARLGSRLALNDIDAEGLTETVRQVHALAPAPVCAATLDVSHADAVFDFAERVKSELGRAHVIINNAGVEGVNRPVWATETSAYERILGINFFGVVHGTRAFLPQLLANGEGAVVNVSSIFGLIGTPNSSDYCASKFAVRGFTESLMAELHETPISVHLVHPGGIRTNISRNESGKEFQQHYLTTAPEDLVQQVIRGIRRGRARIVYGNGARRTWAGSVLLPQKLLKRIIWAELKKVIDLADYASLPRR